MIGHPPLTGVLWLNASEIVDCGEKSVVVSSTHSIDGHWKYGGAQPLLTLKWRGSSPLAPPISPPLIMIIILYRVLSGLNVFFFWGGGGERGGHAPSRATSGKLIVALLLYLKSCLCSIVGPE